MLGAEFNSESNGDVFRGGCRSKSRVLLKKLVFYLKIASTRFARRLVLAFQLVVLDSEFNSESNGIIFRGGYRAKKWSFIENLVFEVSFRVFGSVDIL